jgi:alkanesulfonate monooxygenase SsuD/methylene tetrahydromethanopterin reductase-like flavin-dependent oxidoreductase (luciferase family)
MNFGMLHLFENPIGTSEHAIVHEQLTLMRAAEDYGFDSVWPAEHHGSEYGYCASPALTLATLALETKRLRLGTGVVVLPLNHPLRVAEDYAMLDLMSNGRVDLGVGRGYQPTEFAGYGVDLTRTREMFDASIAIIRQAWTQETVTHHGVHYRFDGVPVRPKPLQRPHPPIWMACLSPETFELAGRYGFHLLFGTAFGLPPDTSGTTGPSPSTWRRPRARRRSRATRCTRRPATSSSRSWRRPSRSMASRISSAGRGSAGWTTGRSSGRWTS